ncbi:hypothetical protein C0Q70_16356 [Pomacea canaliculata]|uniref:Angiotensin-converting enzyme n=1 Tax=Pomacea canaliculata TaxID=400727 RepID=A0A2T7NPJ2_POMCA|nr:hypothetical protein C0Q70_16356 [Pomacea canaliculata]
MLLWLTSLAVALTLVGGQGNNSDVEEASLFLEEYNNVSQTTFNRNMEAAWTFNTNITNENQKKMVEVQLETDLWQQEMANRAAAFNTSAFNATMQRQFYKIKDIGTAAMTDHGKLQKLNEVLSDMESIYSTGKVCFAENDCKPLDPDITRLFETSRDEQKLRIAWKGWRDQTGRKMRDLYTTFHSFCVYPCVCVGYADTGAYWRSWYEMDTFDQEVKRLFEQLKPLYEQLHAFVRQRLKKQYGAAIFPQTGHIPAHLLGNMWAQSWNSLQDLLMPFPSKPILDVTEEMVKQKYTPRKIFEVSDDFFKSLGMIEMPFEFWNKSMLERPAGREVVCHASAWDFYNGRDFRVKQCTDITMDHLSTAHHEMGHIEYFLQYRNQPLVFRDGANPGFHEAVGDVISLSVETPKHLNKIGLLPNYVEDNETDINFLMAMALQKIAFLPFGYLIDQWRWSVFKGVTKASDYNKAWWNLRCGLQGVSPPVPRSEEDFDPGAKYHIPGNTPYIRYFVSYVLQFQFHKALCGIAGHNGPLHTCDIYNSSAAGQKLSAMLSKGSSQVWTESLKELTGQTTMSAQPLMDYFQPLLDYLRAANGDEVGWSDDCPSFADPLSSAGHVRPLAGLTFSLVIIALANYLV